MSDADEKLRRRQRVLRSLAAVVAGYLLFEISSKVLFGIAAGSGRDITWLLHALFALAAGIGGYGCAWIARRAELRHAFALAAVVALQAMVLIVLPDSTYPAVPLQIEAIIALIGIMLGASLRRRQRRRREAAGDD